MPLLQPIQTGPAYTAYLNPLLTPTTGPTTGPSLTLSPLFTGVAAPGWQSLTGVWIGTFSTTTPFRICLNRALSRNPLRVLTYQSTDNYGFKSGKSYQVVTNLYGYINQDNFDSCSFSVSMKAWNETLEHNASKGTTSSVLGFNSSDGQFPGWTNSNYYFYGSPPTNITSKYLVEYRANSRFGTASATTFAGVQYTQGITKFDLREMNYQIQGFAFYKYAGAPYTPHLPGTFPTRFINSLGWLFEPNFNGGDLLHWYDHSTVGQYPVGPCSLSSGGRTNKRAEFGYRQNNFIARFIPYSYFNLRFNYQNEGNFPLEIYMSNTLPSANPGSFSRPPGSQLLATIGNSLSGTYSSTEYAIPHVFYSVQGGRYLIFKGPFVGTSSTSNATYSNIFITNLQIEGGYHPGNNRQYLMTDTDLYSGNTPLEPIGLIGATFSTLVGSGNTVNATSSLSVSQITANVGNGLFRAGIWENGVWNSGWRYDENVYEFSQVFQFVKYNKAKRWRIQLESTPDVISNFEIGDKVSIGNIVAIDINEERKVIRNYFTIINITNRTIIVEFDNDFPLRRIVKDSENHRIYVTKNVWLNGAFFNGLFRGIWNYGLFRGYPLITEMFNSHWIDGIFDGGHFYSEYYTVPKFVDTLFYSEQLGGKVGLTFSEKHGLIVGDKITIDKDNKNINSDYDGETNVELVINDYHIVTSLPWGSDSIAEGGTVSFEISKGLVQKMDFRSKNRSRITSNQSFESTSIFQYDSWMDVNYYFTSAVNIGKPMTLVNESSDLDYSENNLYGYPTKDILQSLSTFRDSYSVKSQKYNLGTKYKIFNDYIGESGEFRQKFSSNTRAGQLRFLGLGWTFSRAFPGSFTFSRTEESGDGILTGEELQIEALDRGGILDIYALGDDTVIGRTNQNISRNRYTSIEFDLVTFSAAGSYYDSSVPSLTSVAKQGLFPSGNRGLITVPQIHFNNINRVSREVYYGSSVGTVSTVVDADFLPNFENVNHILTKPTRKVEYFFNKTNLAMHFLGDNLNFTFSTTAKFVLDNLHFYETDMIPFFKYFENENINKGVQIPFQGISPFIDYTSSSFNFIDNISIGLDSIAISTQLSPPGGVGVGISTGFASGGLNINNNTATLFNAGVGAGSFTEDTGSFFNEAEATVNPGIPR